MARKETKKSGVLLNRTVVIGCGKLGATIANERWKEGKNVVVIDSLPIAFLHLDKDFSGETVTAHAMDLDKLVEAGIRSANEVVIVTGNDNINIFLAHVICNRYCKNIDIYVRLDDIERGILLEDLPVHLIYPLDLSFKQFMNFKSGGKK